MAETNLLEINKNRPLSGAMQEKLLAMATEGDKNYLCNANNIDVLLAKAGRLAAEKYPAGQTEKTRMRTWTR